MTQSLMLRSAASIVEGKPILGLEVPGDPPDFILPLKHYVIVRVLQSQMVGGAQAGNSTG